MSQLAGTVFEELRSTEDASIEGAGASKGDAPRGLPSHVGRFEVRALLGAGSMGSVYRVFDPDLEREVALKVLHRAQWATPERALAEARALAQLRHPNVVTVFEVGVVREHIFVAMELLRGSTLRGWLEGEARKPRDILAMFAQVARGLVAAHEQGVVHRDVKPENIFVTDEGMAVVMDFGLARVVAAEDAPNGDVQLNATGVVGTPAYMSPEQHRAGPVGAAADQFSFAVMLWEALYGERPFSASTFAEQRDAVLNGRRRAAPSVWRRDASVRLGLIRALSTDPAHRFADLEELRGVLVRSVQHGTRAGGELLVAAALVFVTFFPTVDGELGLPSPLPLVIAVPAGFALITLLSQLAWRVVGEHCFAYRVLGPFATALTPGFLLSSLAASSSLNLASASWMPVVLALGVIAAQTRPSVGRIWALAGIVCLSLVAGWMPWYFAAGEPAIYAKPLAWFTRIALLLVLVSILAAQRARAIARET